MCVIFYKKYLYYYFVSEFYIRFFFCVKQIVLHIDPVSDINFAQPTFSSRYCCRPETTKWVGVTPQVGWF